MHARASRILSFCLASALLAGTANAYPGAPSGPVTEEAKIEGKKHFQKALALYEEGDDGGALAEFRRAFELTGSPVALYNVGLVLDAVGQYVEADAALGEVLELTPDPLKPEWRTRAMEARAHARARIGLVELAPTLKDAPPVGATDPLKGAVVELDGLDAGRWPLAGPLRVAVGKHTVGLLVPGYAPARASVLVAGETTAKVTLELVAMAEKVAQLSVTTNVAQASIVIDGEAVGVTPITVSIAVTPGNHVVELKRKGYVTASTMLTLKSGESGEARLDLGEDPDAVKALGARVLVTPSEPDALVSVDGAVREGKNAIALPPGPHRLRVEHDGFLPFERDVQAEEGKTLPVKALLEPTPETLASYDGAVASHRTWGWVGVGAGGAVLATSTLWLVTLLKKRSEINDAIVAHNTMYSQPCGSYDVPKFHACEDEGNQLDSERNDNSTNRAIAIGGMALGGVILGAGVVSLLTGPDSHHYDSFRAKDEARVKWTVTPITAPTFVGLSFSGAF